MCHLDIFFCGVSIQIFCIFYLLVRYLIMCFTLFYLLVCYLINTHILHICVYIEREGERGGDRERERERERYSVCKYFFLVYKFLFSNEVFQRAKVLVWKKYLPIFSLTNCTFVDVSENSLLN